MLASGEGGTQSAGACRGCCSRALSAWRRGIGHDDSRVVQWLVGHWRWTGGGDGRWSLSQTRWLVLVLLLACCRQWGGKVRLGLLTIDGNGKLTVVLEVS